MKKISASTYICISIVIFLILYAILFINISAIENYYIQIVILSVFFILSLDIAIKKLCSEPKKKYKNRFVRILNIKIFKISLYFRQMCPKCKVIKLDEEIDSHNTVYQNCRKCGYKNEYNDSYP